MGPWGNAKAVVLNLIKGPGPHLLEMLKQTAHGAQSWALLLCRVFSLSFQKMLCGEDACRDGSWEV